MKATISIIIIVIGIAIFAQCREDGVTTENFEAKHEILQKQIDSIKRQLVDITINQVKMQTNQDSLKVGQKVIYNEVNKDEISFIDKIKALWK